MADRYDQPDREYRRIRSGEPEEAPEEDGPNSDTYPWGHRYLPAHPGQAVAMAIRLEKPHVSYAELWLKNGLLYRINASDMVQSSAMPDGTRIFDHSPAPGIKVYLFAKTGSNDPRDLMVSIDEQYTGTEIDRVDIKYR